MEQFELWASRARPPVIFWLSGFTFPTGFLTAVLQSSARQNNVSVSEQPGRRDGGGCWGCGFAVLLKDPPLCSPLNPQIPVDNLSWEFIVSTVDDSNLVYPPKVGAEVWGGEGAGSKPWETTGKEGRREVALQGCWQPKVSTSPPT